MRKALVAVVALVASLSVVGSAAAQPPYQAFLGWSHNVNNPPFPDWMGGQVTVDNPAGSQRQISSGDYMLTSVMVGNGHGDGDGRGLQQGVVYEYKAPENSCDKGSSSPAMYYFEELDDYGNYTCYFGGAAATTEAHLQTVKENSSGNWFAYMDGVKQLNPSISWSACGGNACDISAFAEEEWGKNGLWNAKFSGSGRTPLQFYNGTRWSTINNPNSQVVEYPWSGPNGSFPDGLWYFLYQYP